MVFLSSYAPCFFFLGGFYFLFLDPEVSASFLIRLGKDLMHFIFNCFCIRKSNTLSLLSIVLYMYMYIHMNLSFFLPPAEKE